MQKNNNLGAEVLVHISQYLGVFTAVPNAAPNHAKRDYHFEYTIASGERERLLFYHSLWSEDAPPPTPPGPAPTPTSQNVDGKINHYPKLL